ncbi:hypothetical protein PHYSODRAFT_301717 [Phytophthora sojae]|uniref:Uncharacterized protein n=1 Tax=Phytophthora sojae (strain P6497) TaxID=1094619 RepID=G4ZLT4_PHYSP|nr:hypothetical protein PHYSODRAFT_301717 [Phytophthora sojae]EGZ14977.1 hypothetical protein PHYSODRAFT_301717 [Phytophthora sojae]|eukprot:XP_009528726.1 hypothetical protein PHYSODRAFT_301717 [Phytophthora sojae]
MFRVSRYYVDYIVSIGKTEGSWQPRWLLEEDGFAEYLELVDAYKAAAGTIISASMRSLGLPAEMAAARSMRSLMLSIPWGFLRSVSMISSVTFTAHALLLGTRSRRRVSCGPPYRPSFGRLTCLLVVLGARSTVKTLRVSQTQFRLSGVETCLALEHLMLTPEVYLCAGILAGPQRKPHAFMLQVTTAGCFASDDNVAQMPLLKYAFSWLPQLRFVCRVLIC